MLSLSQFGFNVLVASWLVPFFVTALVGNANSEGTTSDFYVLTAAICGLLFVYAVGTAYGLSSSKTVSRSAAERHSASNNSQSDVASVDFQKLSAWKWIFCIIVSAIAAGAAVIHYLMNREAHGIIATFYLVYTGLDVFIAVLAFNQFWAIKSGKIVELTNRASHSMFQN